ncbi:serine hydrolase [Novosphingobium marinum]|uniref:Beta-lactamase n=1 Tax=Novosphingobium marinum TaxID=1514948 RepID=A0A7Y9XX92_9SPHN|nr:serine hydrolase [Novosphingobium marinum]NYH96252.1 beta-lactamase class A [Novosphingobium marinum]
MTGPKKNVLHRILGWGLAAAASFAPLSAAQASELTNVESAFDRTFGTELRAPRTYDSAFERRIAQLADAAKGRIGVAAIDLSSGRSINVLGDQPFPMASTSKIAIVATYLEGVDRGRWSLSDKYPLMVPVPSKKFDGPIAPVRPGRMLSAQSLIELTITRSDNQATDALLAAVGGPRAVNDWVRRAGIAEWSINRDIATLVRDDGAIDPAAAIETRDAATPRAMVQMLSGIYQGKWLSAQSRSVLLGAMERCVTGRRRIPAQMPDDAIVAHKTGSLFNTSSDVGIISTPDGRAVALAIYVTGQGTRLNREHRIASIARAIYDGYRDIHMAEGKARASGGYARTASR